MNHLVKIEIYRLRFNTIIQRIDVCIKNINDLVKEIEEKKSFEKNLFMKALHNDSINYDGLENHNMEHHVSTCLEELTISLNYLKKELTLYARKKQVMLNAYEKLRIMNLIFVGNSLSVNSL